MKIKQLTEFLFNKYPLSLKEVWDPTGFSFKFNLSEKLTGVVLAIDITDQVVDYAIENNCNVILTHHPFLFEKTMEMEKIKAPYKMSLIKKIKQHRINTISFHTNYDNHIHGTSYQIARFMGIENYSYFQNSGYPCVLNYKTTPNQFIKLLKDKIKINSFRTNLTDAQLNENITKIVLMSGSGFVGDINEWTKKGADLIVSSDFRWSDWINFQQINAPILEVPHLDEHVFVWDVSAQIKKKFDKLNILTFNVEQPYRNID